MGEIQEVISTVNRLSDEHTRFVKRRAAALLELAKAVADGDEEKCYSALESPPLEIDHLNPALKRPYMKTLKSAIVSRTNPNFTILVKKFFFSKFLLPVEKKNTFCSF